MNAKPTYEELALSIARCVYDKMYWDEPCIDDKGAMYMKKTVDNMCSSEYQIPTGVLNRLNILEPLDPIARRNDFTCTPDDFKERIVENKHKGCSYDTLILALVCLLDMYNDVEHIYNLLLRLDLCEPNADSSWQWTKKKDDIDLLYLNWPALLKT